MQNETVLPHGFEQLAPLLREWALADSAARSNKRQDSSIETLRSFYEAMAPLARPAVEYLKTIPLGDMPPEAERLLKLMLSLAEVSPAVEWYNSPQVYDGFDVRRLRPVRLISDTQKQ